MKPHQAPVHGCGGEGKIRLGPRDCEPWMWGQGICASFVRQWGPWAACDKRDEVRVVQLTVFSLGIHVWILALTGGPSVTVERSHTLSPNLKGKRSSEPPHCSGKEECSLHIKMIVVWRKKPGIPGHLPCWVQEHSCPRIHSSFRINSISDPMPHVACQPLPYFWIRNCGCWDIQVIGYTPEFEDHCSSLS